MFDNKNEKYNLEFQVTRPMGAAAVSVNRHDVPRTDLAHTVMMAARMTAELLGETVPEPEAAEQGTLVNGNHVEVRLGTTPTGEVIRRAGQVTMNLGAQPFSNGRSQLEIRLIEPLREYELRALEHAYSWSQRVDRDDQHNAQVRKSFLTAFVRAADLPVPTTPAEEAETERALVTALRNWRSTQRMNGTPAEPTGHDWMIGRIREIVMSINDSRDFGRTMADIAELVGLTVERQADQWPVKFVKPDDLDITMGPLEDVRHTVKGELSTQGTLDAEKLADIATLLGLTVERDASGNPVTIVEPRPVTP